MCPAFPDEPVSRPQIVWLRLFQQGCPPRVCVFAASVFLTIIGYSVHGWNLGVNIGPTRRLLDGATDRLIDLSDEHGPVSIIGFSMGGLFARWLALRMPDRVRQVITVCSPIHEPARNFWLPLHPFLGLWPGVDLHKLMDEVAQPLSVGGTFMFSRDDGLVNYTACWDASVPPEDNIEISGPHVLIARNPQVMSILAERLVLRRRSFHVGSQENDRGGAMHQRRPLQLQQPTRRPLVPLHGFGEHRQMNEAEPRSPAIAARGIVLFDRRVG